MGFESEADKARHRAAENVKNAIKNLSKILIDEIPGHDRFTDGYKMNLEKAFSLLHDAKIEID